MKIRKKLYVVLSFMLLASSVILINIVSGRRSLPGPYYLTRFDEGGVSYFIEKKGCEALGGPLEGTVSDFGWNHEYIIANIDKHFAGDTNGWYAICVKTGAIYGPMSKRNIMDDKRFSDINILNAEEFW